jgi:hypothetical protein
MTMEKTSTTGQVLAGQKAQLGKIIVSHDRNLVDGLGVQNLLLLPASTNWRTHISIFCQCHKLHLYAIRDLQSIYVTYKVIFSDSDGSYILVPA